MARATTAASAFSALCRPTVVPRDLADEPVTVANLELCVTRGRIRHDTPVGGRMRIRREALDRRPATHLQHLREILVRCIDDQPSVAGDGAQQQVELPLDRRDVG